MLRAFVAARLADFCADAANTAREVRVARHYARGRGADRRAGAIQLDAACHHFHILLMQAFRRAMLAGDRAVVTGVDTALILFVWHIRLVIVLTCSLSLERHAANDTAARLQGLSQKYRQNRIEHFRRGIGKETGEGEKECIP